jgi:LysR family transcriptional regulator, cys regulon transcriptional activator
VNLVQLRCLVALADSDLRLSVAAHQAHVSERVLLEQLKQIEQELGLPIVLRRGRRIEAITRAGTGIIRRARAVIAGVAGIQEFSFQEGAGKPGRLIVCATHTQAKYALPGALAAFRKEFPNVTVLVREPLLRHEEQEVETCADLVICSTSGSPPGDGAAIPLYTWRRSLVVPHDHPLAGLGSGLTLRRIADFPLISYHPSTRRESSLLRAFASEGLQPQISVTTLNADLVKTYVRAGAGVGILPEMALSQKDRVMFACATLPGVASCVTWAVVPRNRPIRDSTLHLVRLLAPHLEARPLRPMLEGKTVDSWPEIPHWPPFRPPALSPATEMLV